MNNEPVAWMHYCLKSGIGYLSYTKPRPLDDYKPIPLYTHPVKELTEQAEKDIRHAVSCYFDDSTIYGYELSNRIIAILRKA
jgi:hypothetical protein